MENKFRSVISLTGTLQNNMYSRIDTLLNIKLSRRVFDTWNESRFDLDLYPVRDTIVGIIEKI